MKYKLERQILLLIALTSFQSFGQNCSSISATNNKKTGIETFGGVTNSKDFYSLLIHKQIHRADNTTSPIYSITLVAASRVLLSDSMLNTKGSFELLLLDSTTVIVKNVTYLKNALGHSSALGFQAEIEKDKIEHLAKSPIVMLKVPELPLATSFAPPKQKKQQTICNCLLTRQ